MSIKNEGWEVQFRKCIPAIIFLTENSIRNVKERNKTSRLKMILKKCKIPQSKKLFCKKNYIRPFVNLSIQPPRNAKRVLVFVAGLAIGLMCAYQPHYQ